MLLIKVTENSDRFCVSVNQRHFKITFHRHAPGQAYLEKYFNDFYGSGSTTIIHKNTARSLILKKKMYQLVLQVLPHGLGKGKSKPRQSSLDFHVDILLHSRVLLEANRQCSLTGKWERGTWKSMSNSSGDIHVTLGFGTIC